METKICGRNVFIIIFDFTVTMHVISLKYHICDIIDKPKMKYNSKSNP